jgi:hypothetical protein
MARASSQTTAVSVTDVEELLDDLISVKPSPGNLIWAARLKECDAGRAILSLKPVEACALVRAVFPRFHKVDRTLQSQQNKGSRSNNAWIRIQRERNCYISVLDALLARKLPLSSQDIDMLAREFREAPDVFSAPFKVHALVRAFEYFIEDNPPSKKLDQHVNWVKKWLVSYPALRPLSERIDRLTSVQPKATIKERSVPNLPGDQKTAHQLVNELMKNSKESVYNFKDIEGFAATKAILAAEPPLHLAVLRECADRVAAIRKKFGKPRRPWDSRYANMVNENGFPGAAVQILWRLLRRNLPFTDDDFAYLVNRNADLEMISTWCLPYLSLLVNNVERHAKSHGVTKELKSALIRLRASLEWEDNAAEQKLCAQITRLCKGPKPMNIESGEAWSEAALADLKKMNDRKRSAWDALLLHCQTGGKAKFASKWRSEAEPLLAAVGVDSFKDHVLRWFSLVDKPRTKSIGRLNEYSPDRDQLLIDPHVELLRGLVWCCGFKEDAELARALGRLALSSYRKIPAKGPRLVSLGNACVTTLATMPGRVAIGQLAILKVKVKFGTAQKEIEKAFTAAATREGLPRDEIEELAVPSYGLESVGIMRETFDDYQAELVVDGSSARLNWLKEGKPIKSAPAALKKEHPEQFKELQTSVKDINTMLPAQRERIDTLFLAQKTWPLALWRERYLDHPLVGTIARRLLWTFTAKGKSKSGIWHGEALVGMNDKPLEVSDQAVISLWHPIDRQEEEILGWRAWLEKHEVVQPFKQAHREVYVLTDAERNTRTYSNRFAAHILRQHQFNALCLARGWKNKLRLMVDDEFPPAMRLLPVWNLRAEYWVEGIGDGYGEDTNEASVFHRLATDQVRFYRTEAAQNLAHAGGGGYGSRAAGPGEGDINEPLPLEQIPALVFSEIMRDVDLFVGVASVGNDPNWADGGPEGRYRDYWQQYSFGELSATAQTRRALLERLIPRLKIADRCTLADRFLTVRGNLRSYKIHLGSGNILMTPNDQYLCIVPKQSAKAGDRFFLPFEGDGTLSVILSKAFLLADDTKITDPTIVSQLKR